MNSRTIALAVLCLLISSSGCGSGSDTPPAPAAGTTATANGADGSTTSPTGSAPAENPASNAVSSGTITHPADSTSAAEVPKPEVIAGISAPEMPSADEVTLPEEAMVVGVMIGDQPRAYVCEAMSQSNTSVVNDLVEKTPVTVTYHAATKGIRVFSGPESDKPLNIGIQSSTDSELILFFENQSWPQSSDEIPLKNVDYVHTEWIAWKTEHPATRVFQGTPAAAVTQPTP